MFFFAACGVLTLLARILKWKFSHKRIFFRALCIASLAAFAAEATLFNFQYYLKYFAGAEIYTTDVSPENTNFLQTSEGTLAEILTEEINGVNSTGISFKNLDREVTSIFVDLQFDYNSRPQMRVEWRDEEGGLCSFTKNLFKGFPHDNHTPLQPRGKVSELKVMFAVSGSSVAITQIVLNRQIPFYFSGLRLIAVSLLLFTLILLVNRELRAKTAYFLFEYKFNPASKRQALIYALTIMLLVTFSWACAYTTLTKSSLDSPPHQMYNKYLVDALIAKKTYLDYGNPEKMLDWERPYDHHWRVANHRLNVDWIWEWCYFEGKYYSHYGVVPAIILYVPYTLITGGYLSNHGGIFLFSAIAVVMLALFWRFCVKKYMPDARFAFFLLSFLTLFFASGLHGVLIFPRFYTIVQAAALMFAMTGVFLLFKSVSQDDKIRKIKLFFACLCLALIAGCRPNMILVSLLVPVVLWKHRSWKLLLLVAIPYIIVAIPLGWYNYIRFGSFADFGHLYTLTHINHPTLAELNPIGKITRTFIYLINHIFLPNKYSLYFPFVEAFPRHTVNVTLGIFQHYESSSGMINFPIVFCLLYLLKNFRGENRPKTFHILLAFLAVAASVILPISWAFHSSSRYIADYAAFIILPSLFCAYYWSGCPKSKNEIPQKTRLKVVYTLLAASIFVGACLYITGGLNYIEFRNATLYRYLEYSLGIIRDI
jgi:hypothetical protein